MRKINFEEDRKFADFIQKMTEEEYKDFLSSSTLLESQINAEDPTLVEIDVPLEQWIKENNCYNLSEWLDEMRGI